MNNNLTYIDPDHTWTTSAGALNTNLYYKDNLHLIEKGNETLAKAIITALNVGNLKQPPASRPPASTRTPTLSTGTQITAVTRSPASSGRARKTPKRTKRKNKLLTSTKNFNKLKKKRRNIRKTISRTVQAT